MFTSTATDDTGTRWFLLELEKSFIRGPLIQRTAARIFIAQTTIGVLVIPLFWLAPQIGLDVSQLGGSSLIQFPAERFLIGAPAIAKARYDSVFVPLTAIYGASLPVLAAAFLNSLGAAFQNLRKHWRAIVAVPIFIVTPALMIFDDSYVTRRWQTLIVTGDAWGYAMMFVLLPFCLLVLTASLPRWGAR